MLRACDLCGGVDETPRHVISCAPDHPESVPSADLIRVAIENGAPNEAIDALLEPTTLIRHMTCCRDNGCDVCLLTA